MKKKTTSKLTEPKDSLGSIVISSVPGDVTLFYQRLLVSGLRLAPVPVTPRNTVVNGVPTLLAQDVTCTGYLFSSDGLEAPESDLFDFLSRELKEGQGISIWGSYIPEPEHRIRSVAHYWFHEGQMMSTESRTLHRPDGTQTTLRSRSDLEMDNIQSLRSHIKKNNLIQISQVASVIPFPNRDNVEEDYNPSASPTNS